MMKYLALPATTIDRTITTTAADFIIIIYMILCDF